MKVFMIFVTTRRESHVAARYLDSQWASKKAADERYADLVATFKACACYSDANGATAVIYEGTVADTKIVKGDAA